MHRIALHCTAPSDAPDGGEIAVLSRDHEQVHAHLQCSDAVVQCKWFSAVQWCSGALNWCSGAVVQLCSGAVQWWCRAEQVHSPLLQWCSAVSGAVVHCTGAVVHCCSGAVQSAVQSKDPADLM